MNIKTQKKNKIILVPIILFSILFFYLEYQVVTSPRYLQQEACDAIVILGHSLKDGEEPGDWLVYRLEQGLMLYNQGYAKQIIVTGGTGPTDTIAVALSMEKWLIANGVPNEKIITETNAKNTYENFKYVRQSIEADDLEINSILVVSSDFHMYRSIKLAEHFFTEVYGSSSHVPLDPFKILAYVKEPFSIIKYQVFMLFT